MNDARYKTGASSTIVSISDFAALMASDSFKTKDAADGIRRRSQPLKVRILHHRENRRQLWPQFRWEFRLIEIRERALPRFHSPRRWQQQSEPNQHSSDPSDHYVALPPA